jgi:mono/diheme cytochrome c family protein
MPAPLQPRSGERQRADFPRGAGFAPAILLSLSLTLSLSLGLAASELTSAAKKITYEDDVLPIFRDNCLKCHNPDKLKGDLDLTSFSSVLKGGGSGGTVAAGDPDASLLYKSVLQTEEPAMPPKSKLTDKEIAVIKAWISGGLLQGINSKALAASKPAVDLSLKVTATGKPDGPPPLPGPLSLDPLVRAMHGSALGALARSPWAPVVALATSRQISLYRTDDFEFAGVLPFPEGFPHDLKFSRNGQLLLAGGGRGGHSGAVVVWDITTGQRVITIGDQFDSVLSADLSADQKWIALGGPDRVLKIYRTADATLEHRLKKHTEWVTAVEFSPDGKILASGDRNGGLLLWEAATGQEMFTLNGHRGAITSISWRADSELLLSASEDGTVKLWKASDGSSLRSLNANPGGVLSARFSHDGRIVSAGRDNKVQLWDLTGKNLRTLAFTGDLPHRVTFSDDDKRIIASDWIGQVFVWDTATGKPLGQLDSNPPPVAERVQRLTASLTDLQKTIDDALAALAPAEKTAASAKTKLEAVKLDRDVTRVALTAEKAKPAEQQVAATLKSLEAKLSDQQKLLAAATKTHETGTKSVATAKSSLEDARAKLDAAKTSLAKWQSIRPTAPAKPTSSE